MIYNIVINNESIESILKEFPECVIETNDEASGFSNVEIHIKNSSDLVRFFYCGIEAGIKFERK